MKQLAIVNRRSGGIQSPARLDWLLVQLARSGCEPVFTEQPGHARELAAQARCERVVVAGGDGTLSEVLSGMDLDSQSLALIATGRGNSLARDLGLYPIEFGVRALAATGITEVDLMDVRFGGQCRLSASTVAVGYPSAIVQTGAKFRKLGRYCYAAAGAYAKPEAIGMTIRSEGKQFHKRLTGLVINNTRHLANFVGLPDASFQDGRLNVMEMLAGRLGQTIHNLSCLTKFGFYKPEALWLTRELSVKLDEPECLMLDGELFENVTEFEIVVRPRAAKFRLAS